MHSFVVPLNGKEEATEEEKVEWVGVDEDDRNDDGTEAGGAYTFFFDDREEEDMAILCFSRRARILLTLFEG